MKPISAPTGLFSDSRVGGAARSARSEGTNNNQLSEGYDGSAAPFKRANDFLEELRRLSVGSPGGQSVAAALEKANSDPANKSPHLNFNSEEMRAMESYPGGAIAWLSRPMAGSVKIDVNSSSEMNAFNSSKGLFLSSGEHWGIIALPSDHPDAFRKRA